MIPRLLIAAFLMTFVADGFAAELCPRTDSNIEWSEQCFQQRGTLRQVKPEFVNRLRSGGGATKLLIVETRELLAVDPHGREILSNIAYTGDFDLPNPDGVGRFSQAAPGKDEGKRQCGYFREKNFTILVPPRFDYCEPFMDGRAQACVDCVAYCDDEACHRTTLVGGRGVELDTEGKIRRQFKLPEIKDICGQADGARIEKLLNGVAILHCPAKKPGPFDQLK
ncbi:hypothetical protein SAMN05428966_10888 [Massilia sp. PDC64]|nr:hypothetical protein [Massilia sp. PDC64]SDE35927.1 hypothetical protein SAMN05428966_10888 [Massilia sp. PDC64]